MRESLEEVIEESERQTGDLSAQERVMLANLLKFGELQGVAMSWCRAPTSSPWRRRRRSRSW